MSSNTRCLLHIQGISAMGLQVYNACMRRSFLRIVKVFAFQSSDRFSLSTSLRLRAVRSRKQGEGVRG